MKRKPSLLFVILIYITAAFAWFYFANNYLFTKIKTDIGIGFWLKEGEDLLFIFFTAILLYLLIRRNQKSLLKSEEQYRKIVETAHEGIWQIDETGNTVFVNKAILDLLNTTKEEMLGKPMLNYVFKEDINLAIEKMKLHLKGEKLQFEFKLKKRTGEETWVFAKGTPLFDAAIYKGSIGMITDINATRKARVQLQQSEENYKLLFKKNPLPMWVYDAINLNFLAVNEAAVKHYGYTREEFSTMKVTDIRPPEEVAHFLKTNNHPNLNIRNSGIWKHKKKNGELLDVAIVAQSITYNGIEAHLILVNDVTAKLKTEKELQKSYDEIRKLALYLQTVRDDERKRIAREIHDELGQKLTAVKMNLAWLNNQTPDLTSTLKEKLKETLLFTDESNLSIRKILNELRTDFLSRFGTGEALKWQAEQFEKQTGIPIRIIIDDDIDEFENSVAVCLYRVLQESLTNITKHAGAKHVEVILKKQNDLVFLAISDDGAGFDESNVKSDVSFGLLGIKERVSSINGSFKIESNPGKGTSLTIYLPISKSVTT